MKRRPPAGTMTGLRLLRAEQDIEATRASLEGIKARNDMHSSIRMKLEEKKRLLEQRQEEERIFAKKMVKAITLLQAAARAYIARKHDIPKMAEELEVRRIIRNKKDLSGRLLDLFRTMHSLTFLEEDWRRAATRVQAWWRGILAKRTVKVMIMAETLHRLRMRMLSGATRIQACWRGVVDRRIAAQLAAVRAAIRAEEKRAQDALMLLSVLKIQGAFRVRAARKEAYARREAMLQMYFRHGQEESRMARHAHVSRNLAAPKAKKNKKELPSRAVSVEKNSSRKKTPGASVSK